jgi:hypothetical protein
MEYNINIFQLLFFIILVTAGLLGFNVLMWVCLGTLWGITLGFMLYGHKIWLTYIIIFGVLALTGSFNNIIMWPINGIIWGMILGATLK